MRVTQKVIVAAAAVSLCAAVGATLAIPAYAQTLGQIPADGILVQTNGTHVTIDWQDAEHATRYLVQIYLGTRLADGLFVTDSILVNKELTPGLQHTITAIPYRDFAAGVERELAVVTVDGVSTTPTTPTPTTPTPTTPTPTTPTPTTPTPTTPTPTDLTGLTAVITGLVDIIEGLSLKIAVLEAEISGLKGILAGQTAPVITDSGDFVPIYYGATGGSNLAKKSSYESQLFLEGFTGRLTQTLALPHDVYLTMDECGEVEAFYQPAYNRIVICYEFITFLEGRLAPYSDTSAELSQNVHGFVTWVMLHELGHALVDVYDLPITGNEEDAVDQFATIIALEYIPPDQAGNVLYSTLLAWSLGQNSIFPSEGQLAGPHSLASQRFYNIACWMHGSDVHRYSNLVDNNILPEERAVRCQSEYERMSESWYRLVSPFLLDPGSVQPP